MSRLTAGPRVEESRAAVILVHGRGARAEGMLHLADSLELFDVHYRAPQAPGLSWYPHSFLAPLPSNEAGIRSGLASLGAELDDLLGAGMPLDHVVLLGFSQGACLALEYAARKARRYGGVVGLSGGLIGNVQLDDSKPPLDKAFAYEGSLDGTPVFLGCSDVDSHIPLERVRRSQEVMTHLGGAVDMRIYDGMGHTINDDEIEAVRNHLGAVGTTE